MADVDLTIAVKDTGIDGAITRLEGLQRAGKATAGSLDMLAAAYTRYANVAQKQVSGLGPGDRFEGIAKGANTATQALQALENEYRRLARANPNQTASQRLAAFGSNPDANINRLTTLRDSASADPIRDQNTALRQQNEILQARGGLLSAQKSLQDAAFATYAPQLSAATRAMDGLVQAERAYVTAQRESAAAQQSTSSGKLRVAAGLPGAGSFRSVSAAEQQAINAALQNEASALGRVTVATNELAAAQTKEGEAARVAATANSNSNDSFGYFKYLIIAGAAERAAQAILGVAAAAVTAGAEQERAFADVNRTFDGTSAELGSLQQKLTALSTINPISFIDLAQIAALGNQLGVAAQDIESFTTTIAQYSTISGQSAEESATAFGKIANLTSLPAAQFNNLGSSIEYVARTTAATEQSIANTSKEIAALASGAGFSAQAIVGLSGALSSLSIPPERARGSLSLYFGALNKAIATGGPKLAAFSTITGIAKDQLSELVANNQGQQVFQAFVAGLADLNSVAKTTALKEVGLSTIRVDQTMRALAQNVPLVTKSFNDANNAFTSNTELARQYGIIQKTLASQFTEFQNAVSNAAAAVGQSLAPELGFALSAVTNLLVSIEKFSKTPIGRVMATIAGAAALLVATLLVLVGGFALVTAGMKVIPWAVTSLGAKEASSSVVQFLAALVGVNVGIVETEVGLAVTATGFERLSKSALIAKTELLTLPGVMQAVAIGDAEVAVGNVAVADSSVAAAAGLKTMKLALIGTGIGAAVVIVGTLVASLIEAGDAAKNASQSAADFFGGTLPDLAAGLGKDQGIYAQTGQAIQVIDTKVKQSSTSTNAWVGSLTAATGAQIQLGDGTTTATTAIERQTVAYGTNAKEALANALGNSKSFQKLFKDTASNAALANTGFDTTAFAQAILGDPERGGKEYMQGLTKSIAGSVGVTSAQLKSVFGQIGDKAFSGAGSNGKAFSALSSGLTAQGISLTREQVNGLIALKPAYNDAAAAAEASQIAVSKSANKFAAHTAASTALTNSLAGTSDGFLGATSSVSDYRDALQTGLQTVLGFGTILQSVTSAAGNNSKLINADSFNAELSKANSGAVTFFNGIQQLADSGSTNFASQLAAIGPSAQGILSSALNASPETQATLEANARFAAFLASDAFKTAFSAEMATSNDAYAQIFKATGNLDDVKAYIAAQVAGTGAEYERQWDALHPTLPLNVELIDPDQNQLDLIQSQLEGKITVRAKIVPASGGRGTGPLNEYTDTATGASITLPASLDNKTLSASLAYWQANEASTPTQIAAALQTQGFSTDVTNAIRALGAFQVPISVTPTAASLAALQARVRAASGNLISAQKEGGLQGPENWTKHLAGFAGGGGYGRFTGGGSGTSDSLLTRVSSNEYINTSDSVNYWGADLFDSLNRKMLPTSIVSMLSAASRAGSGGPSHVTNVSINQNNPLTRDPLKQLRESSEMVAAGVWR